VDVVVSLDLSLSFSSSSSPSELSPSWPASGGVEDDARIGGFVVGRYSASSSSPEREEVSSLDEDEDKEAIGGFVVGRCSTLSSSPKEEE
jgi:hypothetical protein